MERDSKQKEVEVKNQEVDARDEPWKDFIEEVKGVFKNKIIPEDLVDPLKTWTYIRSLRKKGIMDPKDIRVLEIEFTEGWGEKIDSDIKFQEAIGIITKRTEVLKGVASFKTLR